MAGQDPADPSTLGQPPLELSFRPPRGDLDGVRVGVPHEPFHEPIDPAVADALVQARAVLGQLGATVVDLSIPALGDTLQASFGVILPEAASYHESRLRTAPERIGDQVRGLLEAGMLLPAHVYLRAQRARAAISDAVRRAFDEERLDVLLAPTLPATAQRTDQSDFDFGGTREAVGDAFVRTTAPFNLTGLPAVALPVSLAGGLPTSIQLAARPYAEGRLIDIAREFEAAGPWAPAAMPAALQPTTSNGKR
jgi:aspartyl-tRNA(Asn)/glutamyl-tRNA(Gln) amidotransferase subunit A